MEGSLSRFAATSQRTSDFRSHQILRRYDEVRLRAFFLSFDFDQRRAYFRGGMSDQSIGDYCASLDWEHTTVIARSGPIHLEAVAILVSLPPTRTAVELSIACPPVGDHERIVADLLATSLEAATLRYRRLIVNRELANPGLLALLRENPAAQFGCENIEIDLGIWQRSEPSRAAELVQRIGPPSNDGWGAVVGHVSFKE